MAQTLYNALQLKFDPNPLVSQYTALPAVMGVVLMLPVVGCLVVFVVSYNDVRRNSYLSSKQTATFKVMAGTFYVFAAAIMCAFLVTLA